VSERRRVLGIDYGSVRIGLAVSDAERKIASPLATYERLDPKRDAEFYVKLAQEEDIGQIVVGLPVHTNGREGVKAAEARAFGKWLEQTTGLPVAFFDERFTTVQAEQILWSAGLTNKKRKARRDRLAAQIMLQAYLAAGCPPESKPEALDK
jgi:putative Holliday junction resolvase